MKFTTNLMPHLISNRYCLRIVFRFGSYVNFLGFKIFGLVFLFKKLLDLNSCEF